MVSRYISPNLGPAFRLKALLGDKWHTLNPGEHPLGVGRLALDKYLAGLTPLSDRERVAMADVKRWAEIIDKASETWRPHERWFVKDLLTATKCRSLLFEVEVIIGCVDRTVSGYEWPIYRQGERDIQAQGPDMVIECKITNSTEIGRVLKRTSKARRQSRPEGVPLVAAVGFDQILSPEEVRNVAEEVRDKQNWFLARPDLAAALIVMRTTAPLDGHLWNPLGLHGSITYYGDLLEIRNFGSAVPLPETFSFAGVEGLARIRRQRRL